MQNSQHSQSQQVIAQQQPSYSSRDLFDRIVGSLAGRPDVEATKPSTIIATHPLVGDTETYIVQTYRDKDSGGETVFVQHVSATGTVRMVIPNEVAEVIARQSYSLSKRLRKQSAKESMRQRMAGGYVPNFSKKKTAKRERLDK
jgi:hypothetical protein